MNIEEFAFILMGIIIMIILYIFLGKYLEHRHVLIFLPSGIFYIKQVSAYWSAFYLEYWHLLAISSIKLALTKSCFSMDCSRPWSSQEGIT